jgi:DNA topoisomerase-1
VNASEHPRPPGYLREPPGAPSDPFRYVDSPGHVITDRTTLDRIRSLAVPPAWTHVWISAEPRSHIQAIGVDRAGRTQYRYSAEWTALRSDEKFSHVTQFAAALPRLRDHVTDALATGPPRAAMLNRDLVLCIAIRLLDLGFFRVGSERYVRDNETYGLTTLQRHHVGVRGDAVSFDYTAKEHLHRVVEVVDPLLVPWIHRLLHRSTDDPAFLAWQRPAGGWQPLHSSHVNAYIHTYTGLDATARRFRTWAGTVVAATALGGARHTEQARSAEASAVRATSRLLGNTPAVAKASYIHPGVLAASGQGRTIAPAVASAARRLNDDRLAVLWREPDVQSATLDLLGT